LSPYCTSPSNLKSDQVQVWRRRHCGVTCQSSAASRPWWMVLSALKVEAGMPGATVNCSISFSSSAR
jgi:hypothetical protein